MPTLDFQVAANNRDSIQASSGDADEPSSDDIFLVHSPGGSGYFEYAGAAWTGITIAAGSTITAAHVEWKNFDPGGGSVDMDVLVRFEDVAAPAIFSGATNGISGRTLTTASVIWTATLTSNVFNSSPDISAIIQELINSYSYSSGAMNCVLIARSTSAASLYGYTSAAADAAKLHIEYTEGGTTETISVSGSITAIGAIIRSPRTVYGGVDAAIGTIIRNVLFAYAGQIGPSGEPDLSIQTFLSGSITPSATLVALKTILLDIAGVIVSSGNLIFQIGKSLIGAIAPIANLIRNVQTAYTGQSTPDGNSDFGVQTSLAGSIIPIGTIIQTTVSKLLDGLIIPTSNLIKSISTSFNGAIIATGNLIKLPQISFSGTIGPSSILSNIKATLIDLTGSIMGAGNIIKDVLTAYTGQTDSNGEPDLGIQTSLAGNITSSGIASNLKMVLVDLTGVVINTSDLIKSVLTAFTGQVDANGNPIAGVQTFLSGNVSSSGALSLVSSAITIAEKLFKGMFRGMFRSLR